MFKHFFFVLLTITFISLKATPTPSLNIAPHSMQESPKAAYYEQQLHLTGFQGSGTIEIYSIIGNKIKEIKTQELQNFKTYLSLESGNMYILRVTISGEIHTLKIIAS